MIEWSDHLGVNKPVHRELQWYYCKVDIWYADKVSCVQLKYGEKEEGKVLTISSEGQDDW